MAASDKQQAKRALVKVLLTIALLYSVRLDVNRDSTDEVVNKAFRRVVLKAHPDKGGLLKHAQALNAAKEKWDKARSADSKPGRPMLREKQGSHLISRGGSTGTDKDEQVQEA